MIPRFYMRFFSPLALVTVLLSGCASVDMQNTDFTPLRTEGQYQIFMFRVGSGGLADGPLDAPGKEEKRMQQLKPWLEMNGYDTYEILSRTPVITGKYGNSPPTYRVYYEVRVRKSP
jgi:hypothetical protein